MADNEQKPKRSKKKPAEPVAVETKEVAKAEKAPKAPKKPKNRVEHEGNRIVIAGADVQLKVMTPEQQKAYGVKSITGTMGQPCKDTEVVLTFKSPKAAENFFEGQMNEEEEANEFIDAGGRTEWYSDNLNEMLLA